jgi:hypothetical protein
MSISTIQIAPTYLEPCLAFPLLGTLLVLVSFDLDSIHFFRKLLFRYLVALAVDEAR